MAANFRTFAVHAACIRGVEAFDVTVEVSGSGNIPGLTIVGMADAAVMEARSRIRCALRSSGYEVPRSAITVSLAPGDIRKTGSGLDLPIAVAILALSGQIPPQGLDDCLFVGELALDGAVCAVKGEASYQLLARENNLTYVGGYTPDHVPIGNVCARYLPCLEDLRAGVERSVREFSVPSCAQERGAILDFGDVVGQEIAKRGVTVAAAGGLGLLMVGAPGSGKTMLAQRMTGIMPPIDEHELQEALCIHSVVGEPAEPLLRGERPFRSPHHSISAAGLVGGGRPVRPGEISLAHGGVLYLDELGEFASHTLQMLRQPLESGKVRIVRVDGAYTFPARFQLVAASNPCPCGYLGDKSVACRCSDSAIERYRAKLDGPLADRIDLIIDIARPDPSLMVHGAEGLTTAEMREQVLVARAFRQWRTERREDEPADQSKASLDAAIRSFDLDEGGRETLLEISRRKCLTGRGITRLCRVARTIADLAESDRVQTLHMLEGAQLQGRRGRDAL